MRCPIKMINPDKQVHLSCELDCALRVLTEPFENGQGGWDTIEYCGLVSNQEIIIKNGDLRTVQMEDTEE